MDSLAYSDLVDKIGKDEAKKEVARQLRLFADFVEKGYPDIYSAEVMPEGSTDLPEFIWKLSVTLSYPWPG